jgi:Mg/Co/Ni transporter MgtE
MEELVEIKKVINELLSQKKWAQARELLSELPAPDIADLLPDLEKPDRILLFRLLPRPLASEVFSYLEPKKNDDLMRNLTEEEVRRVLSGLSPDDRTDFFEELPGEARSWENDSGADQAPGLSPQRSPENSLLVPGRVCSDENLL